MTTTVRCVAEEASPTDVRIAAERALERAGLSEDELREQARTDDFQSLTARLAWVIVSALDPAAAS